MKNWFKISKIRQKKLLSIFGGKTTENDRPFGSNWAAAGQASNRPISQKFDQEQRLPLVRYRRRIWRQQVDVRQKIEEKMAISWKSTQLHRATCTYFAILQRENRPLATRANRKWRQKWCKSDNKGGEELMNWKRKKETASQIFYEAFRFTQFTCIGVYCLARDCRKGEGREKERETENKCTIGWEGLEKRIIHQSKEKWTERMSLREKNYFRKISFIIFRLFDRKKGTSRRNWSKMRK